MLNLGYGYLALLKEFSAVIQKYYDDEVGIHEHNNIATGKILVYPNPTTGVLNLIQEQISNYELGITNVEIFDIYGKKLSSHHLITSSSNHHINIAHLPAGIYFVKIGDETVKVVKL